MKNLCSIVWVKPLNATFTSKPRQLPFGEPARIALHQLHCLIELQLSLQDEAHMTIAEGSERLKIEPIPVLDEARYLIKQSCLDHLFGALVDAIVQFRSFPL